MKLVEYIGRKDRLSFIDAIPFLLQVYFSAHNWNVGDSIGIIFNKKFEYILNDVLIKNVKNKIIYGEVVYDYVCDGDDIPALNQNTGEYDIELKMDRSYVLIDSMIKFVLNDIGGDWQLQNELRELVQIDGKLEPMADLDGKYDPKIDKHVCQGIARTLWDLYPSMTLKDMANHRAVQVYGNGGQYRDPKTVPGWLSEVDPRPEEKRRGPKKKSISDDGED